MSIHTLRWRLVALAGIGVFAAAATLSIFSRQSLLTLDASLSRAREAIASAGADAIERELTSDLEELERMANAPRVETPAAAFRRLRLADAACYVTASGSIDCAPAGATRALAPAELTQLIADAIARQRPAVQPFTERADGSFSALAVVPSMTGEGAAIASVDGRSPRVRALLPADAVLATGAGGGLTAEVAGTPWRVRYTPEDGDDPVGTFRLRSLWLAPLLAGLAILFATGIGISVNRPLASMTRAAERIADGDLTARIESGPDEIGQLGAALEHMRRRLLLGKVIAAQEDERRRIARELHDETSQLLAAVGMALHALPARSRELEALVARLQDGVHRLILDLRPALLDDLGLAAAIQALVDSRLRPSGIAARCELSNLEDARLDPRVEIALYRIVQEAVANILRHSGATVVLIQAGLAGGRAWIEIEDDGTGFDPAAVTPDDGSLRGVGLLGMRERAEMLGGTLAIDTGPGAGTRIRVDI